MPRHHSLIWGASALVAVGTGLAGPAACPAGQFVTVQGDQFTLNGQVYKLKGTNYYPQNHMWGSMWTSWSWSEITGEVDLLHDLGLNCVRILVPYSHAGWNGPNVPAERLQQLESLVNLMGDHGIRSIVTLFDWETTFPASGSPTWNDHVRYMTAIVDRLKNNPYVFLWDVKNEPDHPDNYGWCDCNPGPCGNWDCNPVQRDRIVGWLHGMCDEVRARDPNHPVSAGMRWWENLPDVLSFVDVAIFHSYWPNIGTEEIPQTKGYMGSNPKPILVEEWGWPTNPNPCYRDGRLIYDYNETQQHNVYVNHLTAFQQHDIAGGLQWMAFDAKPYTTDQYESFENYFGFWRFGYAPLKPAGAYYRDHFPVNRFPVRPPAPVAAFSATPCGTRIQLSWTNPAEADFRGTMIRYSAVGPPATPADGTLLCDRLALPSSQDAFEHILPPVGTVHYSAFAHDANLQFAEPVSRSAVRHTPGDFDLDGDVDQQDFGHLQACFSGMYVPQNEPRCRDALMDEDYDVDQTDFQVFLRCLSGPDAMADPRCG